MNEKSYKKRLDFQQKLISKQSQRIKDLESELEEKNKIIDSISDLRNELKQNVAESKKYKDKYKKLVDDLRLQRDTFDKEVFNNRWWLIRLLVRLIKFLMK
jgi:chromosome segregation ATPase